MKAERHGFNVIGQLRTASGLGNTVRHFIAALRRNGYPVAGFDIAPYMNNVEPNLEKGELFTSIEELPYRFNLVVAAANRLPQLWLRHARGLLHPRFRNAGMFFWELPVIPPAWRPSLRLFDTVITCSQYVRQAFELVIPDVPTVHAEYPLETFSIPDKLAVRRQFGIPAGATAFCTIYDARSGLMRKNPLGTIKAWKLAFPADADVCLILKSHGELEPGSNHAAEMASAIAGDARIIVLSDTISHPDLIALMSACDVVLSLHRSEGLGLVPLEAMSIGRPVIATGYSGNLTFMTQQNSMLVNYRLVPPVNERAILMPKFAGRNAVWAEPDLEMAASLMRRCRDDASWREQMAREGQRDIARRQVTAWEVPFAEETISFLEASRRQELRSSLRAKVLKNEILDPSLFTKNATTILKRLSQNFG